MTFIIEANEAPSPHCLNDVHDQPWTPVARLNTPRGATGYAVSLQVAAFAEYLRHDCQGPVAVYRVREGENHETTAT